MNISNMRQNISPLLAHNGNNVPTKANSETQIVEKSKQQSSLSLDVMPHWQNRGFPEQDAVTPQPPNQNVDLGNISPTEIKDLIHSILTNENDEAVGNLDVMPRARSGFKGLYHIAMQATNGNQDQKIDLISVIEQAIETKQSLNQSTEFPEAILSKLTKMQEMALPVNIDQFS